MQGGKTPYDIAKMKGYNEVCEELLPPELKKQPEVRSDSARHKVAVSFTLDTTCKIIFSYIFFGMFRKLFGALLKGSELSCLEQ